MKRLEIFGIVLVTLIFADIASMWQRDGQQEKILRLERDVHSLMVANNQITLRFQEKWSKHE